MIRKEENALDLLALLANTKVATLDDDMIIWPHDSRGKLTIKSFYRDVCEGSSNIDFSADAIWRFRAPTKACFSAWAATKGKVPKEDYA